MPNRTFMSLAAIVAVAALAACSASTARGSGSGSTAPCDLRSQDSVFAARVPAFRDCAVDTKVRLLTPDVHPDFSALAGSSQQPPRGSNCYFVDLDYVVDTNGQVDLNTARVARTNYQALADAAMAMLPRLRYEPATRGGAPVRQIVAEHRALATMTVAVPAGQRPSAGSMPRARRC